MISVSVTCEHCGNQTDVMTVSGRVKPQAKCNYCGIPLSETPLKHALEHHEDK